jgi:hypothetical protein
LPAAGEREDRALFGYSAVLGSLLFAGHLRRLCGDLRLGRGDSRDGATLAVGRDFLNLRMYGRAAVTAHSDPRFLLLALGTWHLPDPGIDRPPALMAWLLIRPRAASCPARARG